MPSKVVWSIVATLSGAAPWVSAAPAAGDGASSPSAASSIVVVAQARASVAYEPRQPAPPALLARTAVVATPAVVLRPPAPAALAQGGIVRGVMPDSSQPSMWWVVVMGIVCCRVGARVLRVS